MTKTSVEIVERWFSKLPPTEVDLPIIIVDGLAYSPRFILNEVRRGTELGRRLQTYIETARLGTTREELIYLAKVRLKQILSKYPPNAPIIAKLGKVYTPRELIEEIERESPIGTRLIANEIEHMQRLLRLR